MYKLINSLEWFFRLSILMYFMGGFKYMGINPLADTEGWLNTLVFFNIILASIFLLSDYNKLFTYQKIINLIDKEAMHIRAIQTCWGDDLKRAELNLEKATIAKNHELEALKYSQQVQV